MSKNYRLGVIPGDGTGPEVVAEGLKILAAVADRNGFSYDLVTYDLGGGTLPASRGDPTGFRLGRIT